MSSASSGSIIKQDESGLSLLIPIISVVGICGNVTVLVVYLKKMAQQQLPSAGRSMTNIFIATLAMNDLIACVVVMPLTLIYELAPSLVFTTNAACKLYFLFTASVIPFSAFLMTAISIDRYLAICHPLKPGLTPLRARIVVVVLATLAVTMGTLVAIPFRAFASSRHDIEANTIMMLSTTAASMNLDQLNANVSYPDLYMVNNTDLTTKYATAWTADGCVAEPVFGEFFQQSYHYIHNVNIDMTFDFNSLQNNYFVF